MRESRKMETLLSLKYASPVPATFSSNGLIVNENILKVVLHIFHLQ